MKFLFLKLFCFLTAAAQLLTLSTHLHAYGKYEEIHGIRSKLAALTIGSGGYHYDFTTTRTSISSTRVAHGETDDRQAGRTSGSMYIRSTANSLPHDAPNQTTSPELLAWPRLLRRRRRRRLRRPATCPWKPSTTLSQRICRKSRRHTGAPSQCAQRRCTGS